MYFVSKKVGGVDFLVGKNAAISTNNADVNSSKRRYSAYATAFKNIKAKKTRGGNN